VKTNPKTKDFILAGELIGNLLFLPSILKIEKN